MMKSKKPTSWSEVEMKLISKIIPFIILTLLLILPVFVRKNLTSDINLNNRTIKLATGAEGGIYKPLGQGLVTLFNQEIPSGNFELLTTRGSVDNLHLLGRNNDLEKTVDVQGADLAFIEGDIALSAFNGEIGLPESSHLRGILALYREFFQVFVRDDAKIEKFEDIGDKIVAVGDYGSSLTHNARILCEAADIDFDKLDKRYMPFMSALKQLEKDEVDVVFFFGGGKLKDIENIGKTQTADSANKSARGFLKLLPLSKQTIGNLKADKQPFIPIKITHEDYEFLGENIETVGHVAMLVCRESMSEALVVKILEIILENTDKLRMSHPIAGEIKEVDQNLVPLPLHNGVKDFSGDRVEYFTLTLVILLSVLFLAFLISMRIIYPDSFSRFLKALMKTSQGKGFITLFSVIFFFMGIVLLIGAALLTGSEISSHSNHYADYQSSLQSIIKVITTGFDSEYMPVSYFGSAIINAIFVSYILLLIILTVNITVLIAIPYQQAAPAKITIKIKDEFGKLNKPSIAQTKDFSEGGNES